KAEPSLGLCLASGREPVWSSKVFFAPFFALGARVAPVDSRGLGVTSGWPLGFLSITSNSYRSAREYTGQSPNIPPLKAPNRPKTGRSQSSPPVLKTRIDRPAAGRRYVVPTRQTPASVAAMHAGAIVVSDRAWCESGGWLTARTGARPPS